MLLHSSTHTNTLWTLQQWYKDVPVRELWGTLILRIAKHSSMGFLRVECVPYMTFVYFEEHFLAILVFFFSRRHTHTHTHNLINSKVNNYFRCGKFTSEESENRKEKKNSIRSDMVLIRCKTEFSFCFWKVRPTYWYSHSFLIIIIRCVLVYKVSDVWYVRTERPKCYLYLSVALSHSLSLSFSTQAFCFSTFFVVVV